MGQRVHAVIPSSSRWPGAADDENNPASERQGPEWQTITLTQMDRRPWRSIRSMLVSRRIALQTVQMI